MRLEVLRNTKISARYLLFVFLLCVVTVICCVGCSGSSQNSQDHMLNTSESNVSSTTMSSVTLLAVGDNLIEDRIYNAAKLPGGGYDFSSIFSNLKTDIQSADIAVINQETPLVDGEPSSYRPDNLWGTPRNDMCQAISDAGFDVVLNATNHELDRGPDTVIDALAYWQENYPNITQLGAHKDQQSANEITIVEKNDIKFAMLNYTYGLNGDLEKHLEGKPYLIDILDKDKVKADIQNAKERADFVIVFAHMGKSNVFYPSEKARKWAKYFANQGADLMIGAHPHVVQPVEWVKGKNGHKMLTYYSLGNFVSYQLNHYRVFGAMADVQIVKDDKGTRVQKYEIIPIVCHSPQSGDPVTVYKLSDYSDELCGKQEAKGLSVYEIKGLFEGITGRKIKE